MWSATPVPHDLTEASRMPIAELDGCIECSKEATRAGSNIALTKSFQSNGMAEIDEITRQIEAVLAGLPTA